jgi:hypothetical protein
VESTSVCDGLPGCTWGASFDLSITTRQLKERWKYLFRDILSKLVLRCDVVIFLGQRLTETMEL